MNDFIKEGIKVGDRLYSILGGWGKVKEIKTRTNYPIIIQYDKFDGSDVYDTNGRYYSNEQVTRNCPQSLFWDEPFIQVPFRPKREVIKDIDVYVNYDPMQPYQTESFCSEARADYHCSESDIRVKGKLTFTILE